jgi:hypothetical protein
VNEHLKIRQRAATEMRKQGFFAAGGAPIYGLFDENKGVFIREPLDAMFMAWLPDRKSVGAWRVPKKDGATGVGESR